MAAAALVGAASLSLALFCVVALVRYVHVPEHFSGDVAGWIVVNHYSKLQEQINYFGALAIVAVIGAVCSFGAVRFAGAIATRFELDSNRALLAGTFALLPAPFAFFVGMPHAGLFLHPFTYLIASVFFIVIGGIAVWRVLLFTGPSLRAAVTKSAAGMVATLPERPPYTGGSTSAARLVRTAIVLLLGCYCGWFVPVFFSFAPTIASFASSIWLVFPIAFLAAYIRLSFVVPEDVAILAFIPPSLLILFPPLLEHRRSTLLLGVVVIVSSALAASFVVRRSAKLRAPSMGVLAAWLTMLGAFVYPWTLYSYNPHLLHGINIGPVDGDNQQAWLHDATLGRLPYKNFDFPYGPLEFYFQFVPAHIFGLDRFGTPFAMASGFLAFLISAITSCVVFVRTWAAMIAAPITLLAFGYELRVLTAYLALVSSMQAFAKRGRWAPFFAGITWGIAILFAPEFAVIAGVAAVALAFYVLAEFRKSIRLDQNLRPLAWIVGGSAIVVLPALLWLYVTGMLGPYVVSFAAFIGVLDQCCGVPFAPLLDSGGLVVPAQGGFLYLLDAPTFQMYYLPAVIYSVTIVYVVVRRVLGGALHLKDRYLLGILVFGVLAFRYALGRSDEWHVSNSALAALVLTLMFGERLILGCWASLRSAFRERSVSQLALNCAGVVASISLLLLIGRVLDFNATVTSKVEAYAAALAGYYQGAYAAPTDRVAGNDSWKAIVGPQGQQYLFREPNADNFLLVLQYLRKQLKPGDRVYGVPYAARYEVLLDLPTPIDFGPELWSAAVRPVDEKLWISQIDVAKPRYIIYEESEWPNGDGVSWLDRYPLIISYIFSHYHIEKIVGKTVLFAPGAPTVPVPDHLAVADLAQMPYLLAGWYYPEDSYGGEPARWMAPHARAVMTRSSAQHEFYVAVYLAAKPERTLTIKLNGVDTVPLNLTGSDGWRTLQVAVPQNVPAGRPIDVDLSVNPPMPPSDNRMLGAAVSEMGFTTSRALAARDRAAAFALVAPRAIWNVREMRFVGGQASPAFAFAGSVKPVPGAPAINAVFVSTNGVSPAPVDELRTGAEPSFSGRYALNDVPPGENVFSFRGLAIDIPATDSVRVPYSIDYAQEVTIPSARSLSLSAVTGQGRPSQSARYTFGSARTIEGSAPVRPGTAISVGAGEGITISGSATDPHSGRPGSAVVAVVDGKLAWLAEYGPDGTGGAGFFARLPTGGLVSGSHQLSFVLRGADGRAYNLGAPLTMLVHSRPQDSWIDAIDGQRGAGARNDRPAVVSRDVPFSVSGWAVDAVHRDALAGAGIAIDGRLIGPVNYGATRSDVAAAFNTPEYVTSGFTSALALDGVGAGKHTLQIFMRTKSGAVTLSRERRWVVIR